MEKLIGTNEFLQKANKLICEYHNERTGKYEQKSITIDDVQSVINYCILGNFHGMFSINNQEGFYYRMRYFKMNDVFALTFFSKFNSTGIRYFEDEEDLIKKVSNYLYEIENIPSESSKLVNKISDNNIEEVFTKTILEIVTERGFHLVELTTDKREGRLCYIDIYKKVSSEQFSH